jgi:hypothetical protein
MRSSPPRTRACIARPNTRSSPATWTGGELSPESARFQAEQFTSWRSRIIISPAGEAFDRWAHSKFLSPEQREAVARWLTRTKDGLR